jgi:hypothetical protein
MKDFPHAFVSYSREDAKKAGRIIDWFKNYGWDVSYDRELPAGPPWEQEIDRVIATRDCLIALISKSSVQHASRCHHELAKALECQRSRGRPQILPFGIDDTEAIPPALGHLNLVSLHGVSLPTQRDRLRAAADKAMEQKCEYDFWGDPFFESDLQLAVAERRLENGRWRPEVTDPDASDAQAEGVVHWLAVQDIRAAVHLTNRLQQVRDFRRDGSMEIQVVHGNDVNLEVGKHCAIALGLGFNGLTQALQNRLNKSLFEISWPVVTRNGFTGKTDDFELANQRWSPPDGFEKALLARIVLPREVPTNRPGGRPFAVYFVCAGRTAPGTAAAGWYLSTRWRRFLKMIVDEADLNLARDSVAAVLRHKAVPPGVQEPDSACEPARGADGKWVFVSTVDRELAARIGEAEERSNL